MKNIIVAVLLCALFLSILILSASAAHPDGYWPYHVAYNEAVARGNIDEILRTGDELLNFYAQFPINYDIAANSYNVYNYRYINSVFEKRGDYAAALDNLDKLLKVSEIAGFPDMDVVTAAKARKIKTRASVYTLSNKGNPMQYGAPYEPTNGILYGRVLHAPDGKLHNLNKVAKESVCSLYLGVGGNTLDEFMWILQQIDFSNKALHISYNFDDEGTTVTEILSGMHDDNIRKNFSLLAEWEGPVFCRIGGEMNIWTNPTTPDEFIAAYRYVAQMAREIAPNLALIFSPSLVGTFPDKMERWYPGDDLVDYVGVSLYFDYYFNKDTCDNISEALCVYYSAGHFADPILAAAEVVETFGDRKPIFVTEGGSAHYFKAKNIDRSAFAAEKIERLYRLLPIVYPQIKAIIYFDVDRSVGLAKYDLEDNRKVEAAYDNTVLNSRVLLHGVDEIKKSYVRLEDFRETAENLRLFAYANAPYSKPLTVTYALDGQTLGTGKGIDFEYTLPSSNIAPGAHTLTATFSDGENFTEVKTYSLFKNTYGVLHFSEQDLSGEELTPSPESQTEFIVSETPDPSPVQYDPAPADQNGASLFRGFFKFILVVGIIIAVIIFIRRKFFD
ncbi:MAG: hypothetical protein IJU41_03280 [Clostridia bacterium]|nr:hypothetical protein [Clostridia bacterium]